MLPLTVTDYDAYIYTVCIMIGVLLRYYFLLHPTENFCNLWSCPSKWQMERLLRAEEYLDQRQARSRSCYTNERTLYPAWEGARQQNSCTAHQASHSGPRLKLFRPQYVAILFEWLPDALL